MKTKIILTIALLISVWMLSALAAVDIGDLDNDMDIDGHDLSGMHLSAQQGQMSESDLLVFAINFGTLIRNPYANKEYGFEEPEISGTSFYIDPVNGSPDGTGSFEDPWQTLEQVIEDGLIEWYCQSERYNSDSELELINPGAPVKGGDCLVLMDGYHGHINQNHFVFKDWLTITAAPGHTPVLSQFKLVGTFEKVYLKELHIIKEDFVGGGNFWEDPEINTNTGSCIYLGSSSFWGKGQNVKLNGLTIKTARDTLGWTASEWSEKINSGISVRNVENVEIVNCHLENIGLGISIDYFSDYSVAVNNVIKNYSLDGIRMIGNNLLVAYNTITDCIDIDENHDDALQSFSRGEDNSSGTGILYNNIIRGNLMIGTTDFSHPLAGSPQGIGCFDGMFKNWIVENNVVAVDHYHGISFYGMVNSKILNNTVVDQDYTNSTSPWIQINPHKNGTPSEDCIVANNIVFRNISVTGENVVKHHNYIIGNDHTDRMTQLFQDPEGFDFHLRDTALTQTSIINQGQAFPSMFSTTKDKDKTQRDLVPDLGAYEF